MPTRDVAPVGAPCWIEVFTSDVEKARAFYGELFGWTSDDPDPGLGGYFNFAKDGVRVAGGMGNDGSAGMPDMWSVYLAVDDAQKAADAATAAGATVFVAPMEVMDLGTMTVMVDPGGATIGTWQPGTHPGFGVMSEPAASTAQAIELGGAQVQGPDDTPYGQLVTIADPTGLQFKLQQPPTD